MNNAFTPQKNYTRFDSIQLFLALVPIVSFLLQQTHLGIATAIAFCLVVLKSFLESVHFQPQKHYCEHCHKLAVLQAFTIHQKRIALCAECYLHSPAYKRNN